MAKIKKAIDWEGDFLNIYDQIERKDLSPSAIEHKWTPFGIKKEGTAVNAELLNDFQKNGIYGTLNTVKEIINSVERYIIKDFYGIEEFGVFEELKLKIKISDANNEDNPKLVLNSIEYSMIYSTETSFVNIKKGQLEKNKIYNLIFNGVAFIVESSSLKATADSSGLMSLSDVRKEIANLSGAPYDGVFGPNLKAVVSGKTYYYWDSSRNVYVTYMALKDISNANGILTPDTLNFNNLSNLDLSRRGSRNYGIVSNGSGVDLPARQSWTYTYKYPDTLAYENILCVRLTVTSWMNAYIDSIETIYAYKNDSAMFRHYANNYHIVNNGQTFDFTLNVSAEGMTVKLLNNSTSLLVLMSIKELKVFY